MHNRRALEIILANYVKKFKVMLDEQQGGVWREEVGAACAPRSGPATAPSVDLGFVSYYLISGDSITFSTPFGIMALLIFTVIVKSGMIRFMAHRNICLTHS